MSESKGPPDLETDVSYAITICPCDRMQGYGRGINRMRTVYEHISNKHLLKWKKHGIEFKLYWECKLPPHPKRSRYHFHGTILFTKASGLFHWYNVLYDALRDDFNTMIKVITSEKEWDVYLKKQQPLLAPMCKHFRVPQYLTHNPCLRVVEGGGSVASSLLFN